MSNFYWVNAIFALLQVNISVLQLIIRLNPFLEFLASSFCCF